MLLEISYVELNNEIKTERKRKSIIDNVYTFEVDDSYDKNNPIKYITIIQVINNEEKFIKLNTREHKNISIYMLNNKYEILKREYF